MPYQPAGETVFVGSWLEDEDFAVHPKGSQPKKTLTCPATATQPYLIPGHSYIFKTAKKDWQAQQLWSEVAAYRLGSLVGARVPPCFVAVDEATGQAGVLMEFFFGYPGEAVTPRLIHGGDILTRVLADRRRGRPHGVRTNVTLCRRYGIVDAAQWWGAALVFDSLISNVDRHPDNLGLLSTAGHAPQIQMAPLFDNGTSLGYGISDENLDSSIDRFLSKGLHHCGWDPGDDERAPHVEL